MNTQTNSEVSGSKTFSDTEDEALTKKLKEACEKEQRAKAEASVSNENKLNENKTIQCNLSHNSPLFYKDHIETKFNNLLIYQHTININFNMK